MFLQNLPGISLKYVRFHSNHLISLNSFELLNSLSHLFHFYYRASDFRTIMRVVTKSALKFIHSKHSMCTIKFYTPPDSHRIMLLPFFVSQCLLLTATIYLLVPELNDLHGKSLACHSISLSLGFLLLALSQFHEMLLLEGE